MCAKPQRLARADFALELSWQGLLFGGDGVIFLKSQQSAKSGLGRWSCEGDSSTSARPSLVPENEWLITRLLITRLLIAVRSVLIIAV
jgi:hypothetical protein